MVQKTNLLNFGSLNSFQLSIAYHNPKYFPIEHEPPLHIHDAFEIYLNLNGYVSFIVENHTYPITKGSVIITRPYEYHHCIFHDNKEHEHYCLQFSGIESDDLFAPFFARKKGINNHIILNSVLTASIIKHFDKLLNIDENSIIDKYYHFIRILQIVENNTSNYENEALEDIPEKLRAVLDIIATRYSEPITINSLAAEVFVSVNTLERNFRRYLNITPKEYIRRKRLSAAMQCLNNNISISQVAMQCGFSDTSHFIQTFKHTFGQTPYQYMKNNHTLR